MPTILQNTHQRSTHEPKIRSIRDLIARWPEDRPLVCCASAGPLNDWNRYTVVGLPTAVLSHDPRAARTTLRALGESPTPDLTLTHNPIEDLDAALRATTHPHTRHDHDTPFTSGWIGTLGYELGRSIEPRATFHARDRAEQTDDRDWPLYTLFHCPGALVHDRRTDTWHAAGDTSSMPELHTEPTAQTFDCSPFRSASGRDAYERAVARAIDYTHAGDIYQSNIAHRLTATLTGSTRAAFLSALAHSTPWYAACIEIPAEDGSIARAVASASPELFLHTDPSGRIVTRPIKGTQPADLDARDLLSSEKNAAELAMIVDLMRNDIGRICAPGRVRVANPRELERHAPASPLHHTTATVEGQLRQGVSRADILRAAFPPGSITGAPKVRAMQIIDELEPVPRGPYTGSVAIFPDDGTMTLSVAIRTAALTRAGSDAFTLDYHAGAGIVADSDPSEEWRETLDKSRAFARALRTTIEHDA